MGKNGKNAVLLAVLAITAAALVHGAERAVAQEGGAGGRVEHLAVRALTPEEAAAGVKPEVHRFATFADAVRFASGGAVNLGLDANPTSVTAEDLAPSGPAALLGSSVLVGIDYDATYWNSGSGSLTWYVSNPSGCSGGATFVAYSMPSGWNDRVSSALALGGCSTYRHYEHTNNTGADYPCTCGTMGALDNKTSSEKWQP